MHDGKRAVDFASTVTVSEILPTVPQAISSDTCCGPPPAPASSSHERPGYRLLPFVDQGEKCRCLRRGHLWLT